MACRSWFGIESASRLKHPTPPNFICDKLLFNFQRQWHFPLTWAHQIHCFRLASEQIWPNRRGNCSLSLKHSPCLCVLNAFIQFYSDCTISLACKCLWPLISWLLFLDTRLSCCKAPFDQLGWQGKSCLQKGKCIDSKAPSHSYSHTQTHTKKKTYNMHSALSQTGILTNC